MRLGIPEVVSALWHVTCRMPLAVLVTVLVLFQGCASKEAPLEDSTEAGTEQATSNEELAPIPPAPPVMETGLSNKSASPSKKVTNSSKKKSAKTKKISPKKKAAH